MPTGGSISKHASSSTAPDTPHDAPDRDDSASSTSSSTAPQLTRRSGWSEDSTSTTAPAPAPQLDAAQRLLVPISDAAMAAEATAPDDVRTSLHAALGDTCHARLT